MQAVVAAPIIDESMPVYVDTEGVSKEAVRWLWFAGDVLAPRRKRELRELYALGVKVNGQRFPVYGNGGTEINTPCMVRTHGVLPRAMLTPMEIGAVWTPQDLIPDGAETFRGVATENAKWTPTLPGLKTYPGEAIRSVLAVAQNDQGVSQGVVEVAALRGLSWQEGEAMGAQSHFFPTWPRIPATLRELENVIRAGIDRASTSTFEQIGDAMLSSCDQFRLWAMERIKFEETLVMMGTTKDGYTHRLSDVAEQLMAQLEITPQSKSLQEATRLQAEFGQKVAELVEQRNVPVTDTLMTLINAQKDAFAEAFASAIEKVLDKVTAPATPADAPKPPKNPSKNS